MADPATARALPLPVLVRGRLYRWIPGLGLDPAVVETIRPWIAREAYRVLSRGAIAKGLELEDLLQQGLMGGLEAARAFDPAFGTTFLTYAQFRVRKRMLDLVQDEVHITRRGRDAGHRVWMTSLDAPLRPQADGDLSLAGLLPSEVESPEVEADRASLRDLFHRALAALKPREREILRWRYGLGGREPRTFEALGQTLGVSRQRVQQVEAEALAALRRALERQGHRPHLI